MSYYGYMGKILYVDLTKGYIREEKLDLLLARKFIGDFGINARLAYDLMKPGLAPLSAENPIIIGAGPLAGTPVPGASRCTAWSKWPVTNTIGPAGGPMGFSNSLKYAGYDHLVVTGRADKPVYLKVFDNAVEICDAEDLWGKDTYEVTDEMWRRHGTSSSVICIGQAGENLVTISLAIIDKQGSLGRFGLGAVMGSKKLKAIVAGGRKRVKVADPIRFIELTDKMMKEIMAWPIRDEFVRIGHMESDFDGIYYLASVPNYDTEKPLDVITAKERFGPDVYLERAKKARFACPGCPVGCREVFQIKQGEYKGQFVYHQSFTHNYPTKLQLHSIEEAVKYLDVANRYGIDKMAATQGIDFLMNLHERGILAKDDLEGFRIGDGNSALSLMEKIAFGKGIGKVLADGCQGMTAKVGREVVEKYGHYIKDADCWFNPRNSKIGTMQLDLALSPIGPNSGKGGMVNPGKFDPSVSLGAFRKFGEIIDIPPEKLERILDTPLKLNVGRLLRHTQDFFAAVCSVGLCIRAHINQFYSMGRLAELYSSVTGIEIDSKDLKTAGERAWNVLKVLNVREGQTRKADGFPQIAFEPLKFGDKELRMKDQFETKLLTPTDLEDMMDDYYDESGWDIKQGIPTKRKLVELSLVEMLDDRFPE